MYRRVERGGGRDIEREIGGEKEKKERIERERGVRVYIVNEKFKRGKKSCRGENQFSD